MKQELTEELGHLGKTQFKIELVRVRTGVLGLKLQKYFINTVTDFDFSTIYYKLGF